MGSPGRSMGSPGRSGVQLSSPGGSFVSAVDPSTFQRKRAAVLRGIKDWAQKEADAYEVGNDPFLFLWTIVALRGLPCFRQEFSRQMEVALDSRA